MAEATGRSISIPSELWNTMRELGSTVKNRLEQLQGQRHIWGEDRIDNKTMSDMAKLSSLFSQLDSRKSEKVPDWQTQMALHKDQCASLRDSLRLANFREFRLIARVDEQRGLIRKFQIDNNELRERVANGESDGTKGRANAKNSGTENGAKMNGLVVELNVNLQKRKKMIG